MCVHVVVSCACACVCDGLSSLIISNSNTTHTFSSFASLASYIAISLAQVKCDYSVLE